jgi:hypothetical protein
MQTISAPTLSEDHRASSKGTLSVLFFTFGSEIVAKKSQSLIRILFYHL